MLATSLGGEEREILGGSRDARSRSAAVPPVTREILVVDPVGFRGRHAARFTLAMTGTGGA
ncbi:MAG: hypothetical protein D6788_08885, partial [Planctomycetota bacterium]